MWNNNQFYYYSFLNHSLLTAWKHCLFNFTKQVSLSKERNTVALLVLQNNGSSWIATIPMAGLQTAIHWQLQKTEEYLMFLVPIGFLDYYCCYLPLFHRYLRAEMKGQRWRSSFCNCLHCNEILLSYNLGLFSSQIYIANICQLGD